MRRSRSRLAAANGLSFDQVAPAVVVARPLPRVAEHHAGHRHRPLTGEHAQLVAVGIGVEVAEQHRGKAAGPALAHERADRRDLLLARAAVIGAPAQVRAEHLDRAARPVDLGQHHEALLALVVGRARAFAVAAPHFAADRSATAERTAFPERAPSRSRLAANTGSV